MSGLTFKHIYGPVYSWRMGMSLGIDPLSHSGKYCSFACPYCQLGAAQEYGIERRNFILPADLTAEILSLPADCRIDYLTFSGNGEPTLAANLADLIKAARQASPNKVAVITNSATITQKDVQSDLALADLVLFKLDAADEAVFQQVNRPAPGITLAKIVEGIKAFRKIYKGKLALQMMFVSYNQSSATQMAQIARDIAPDEVHLNTPLRPSALPPLSVGEMSAIKRIFVASGLPVLSVYEEEKKEYKPFDAAATVRRHGRYNE
ncbi:MAG: radical SAM protein [Candidatus Omnitrophica bacterium]|nr:radical SAM protein [Candidatus Omnitrophota bacterium]